jgi:hypothetical protein
MTTAELLRTAGEALYGARWQSALAQDLAVSDRTVRHWLAGRMQPRAPVWAEIDSLLRERARVVAAAQRLLARETGSPDAAA